MAALPRSYRSIEDFEREEIRPSFRIGFTLGDLVEENAFEAELDFGEERDDFALDSIDEEEDEDEDDDDTVEEV